MSWALHLTVDRNSSMSLFQLVFIVPTQAEQSKARSRLTKLFNISSSGPI